MKVFKKKPIGVFDSGLGGLSVLKELTRLLPAEDFIYVADQARVPYGSKSSEEIRRFSDAITCFFLEKEVKLIVVACNTATAAALTWLRARHPHTRFIGMEPAVKPAALATRSGKVGVLATEGTFKSERYASLMERFAHGIEVLEDPCLGLVQLIEAGKSHHEETEILLRSIVQPMLNQGVDTLVLGCTHYPFVLPLLEIICGEGVAIINPAPAVARHTRSVLEESDLVEKQGEGSLLFYTSGDLGKFRKNVAEILGDGGKFFQFPEN